MIFSNGPEKMAAVGMNGSTCTYAAGGGHLEVLKWARANGCPWNNRVLHYAAKYKHAAIVNWAVTNGCPFEWGV